MTVPAAHLVDGNALISVSQTNPLPVYKLVLSWLPVYDRGFVDGPRYDTPCGVGVNELKLLPPNSAPASLCADLLASFLPAYYRPARSLDGRLYPTSLR